MTPHGLCWSLLLLLLFTFLFVTHDSNVQANDIRLKDNTIQGTQLATNVLPDLRGEHRIYSLLQTRGSQYFALNNRTGQLSSARPIDRDLLCAESGLCCPSGSAASVDTVGHVLTAPSSVHLSQACFGQRSGPVVMAQACTFNLSVSVVSAPGQQPDIHQITVTICEENDHVPQFKIPGADSLPSSSWASQHKDRFLPETTRYAVNISEGVPVGQRISLPLAEDIDAPPFNVQRYELERLDSAALTGSSYAHSQSNPTPFRLEPIWDSVPRTDSVSNLPYTTDEHRGSIVSLELVLVEPLDRETVPHYQYRVLAIDGGSPALTGTLLLDVHVLDTNDHAPQFTQTVYEATVDEGVTGKEVIQLLARDADEGPNAIVRYDWPDSMNLPARSQPNLTVTTNLKEPLTRDELIAAPPSYWFHLNAETGSISIRRPLDYEIKTQHRFHVLAHNPITPRMGETADRRGTTHRIMTATASVVINVRNLDDEPPDIVIDYASGQNQNYKEIMENSVKSFFVAFVTVFDPDVVSELTKTAGHRATGDLSAFSDSTFSGLTFGHTMVSCDLDSHQDSYTLVQQNQKYEPYAVEQRYSLLTKRSLDREQSAIDRIRIACQDSGSPPKTATATAEVHILDENDCAPELQVFAAVTSHGTRQLPVDPWPSAKLGQWIEQQRDTPALIHPSIMAAYLTQVPVYTVHVAENQPAGTIFARIRATDPDAGENGRVTFDLPRFDPLLNVSQSPVSHYTDLSTHPYGKIKLPSSTEAQELFTVDPNRGDVRTRKQIDREEGYTILEQVFLVVQATDHGSPTPHEALLLLHILIDDENDNPPMFIDSKMHFTIRENLPAPEIVGEIQVIDPDLRPMGMLDSGPSAYSLYGTSSPARANYALLHPYPRVRRKNSLHVRIDPSHNRRDLPFILYPTADGRFFLNTTRSLDRESEAAFQFVLIAVDGGDLLQSLQTTSDQLDRPGFQKPVHHTATASVLITVLDTNDNQPEIIFPNPSASNSTVHRVSFREHAGYEIVNINANDRDAGEANGKFYFELVPGSRSEDLFSIDRVTGLVRTRRRLTKEDLGEHTLHVVVRDQGDPPLETQLTLHLVVDQSEPHWPYTSRSNVNYLGTQSSATHSGMLSTVEDGYLGKGSASGSGEAIYSSDGELLSSGELKRPIHADIMLFVIVALILGLIIIMLGLCLYLRHKRNLFLFLPDVCVGCSSCPDGTGGSGPMASKTSYSKTYLDLEHRGANTGSSTASPALMTNLLSGEKVTGKKNHPFGSISPLQSPIPSNRCNPSHSSAGALVSAPFGQSHSRSSFNLNSPYGNYNTPKDAMGPACPMIDGMPIRQGLAFSPTMIGSEGLFCPSSAAYRPGTTMAVNIPDVANQAETMRKQYVGYCQATHPGVEYGPRMEHVVDSTDFANSTNGPANTYNVGHYAGHRIGQTYMPSENTGVMFAPPTSFDQFPRFGFQAIDEDMHPYQRIGPIDHYAEDHALATALSNPISSKSSQGRHKKHKTGRSTTATRDPAVNSHDPDDQNSDMDAALRTQLTQWRSDPSLNHFEVNPVGPYALRSGHRSTYEFNNTIHANVTPRKSLKRSNSNKHTAARAVNGYYSTLHESVKQPGSPKLMLVDFAGSKLATAAAADRSTKPTSNYAVSFPKVQASFV